MVAKNSPVNITKYEGLKDLETHIPLKNTAIPILVVYEGGSENPF